MHQPRPDPRDQLTHSRLTWTDVIAAYTMAAAVPLLLWATSAPLAAGVGVAVAAGVVVAARRVHRLAQCVRDCSGLSVDLPGTVRVTVAWAPACESN